MPLDKSTILSEDEVEELGGDPDNPVDTQSFVGFLSVTARVHIGEGTVVPSYGSEDNERILAICKKYAEAAGNYEHALWFVEAEGISVVRTDGEPFRQHEVLKIQSADGRNLGKNMAPAKLAEAFTAHEVSASYAKAGHDDSALEHVFFFKTEKLDLGRGYTKEVRLFPQEHYGPVADYEYDGEIREVTPRSADKSEGATEASPTPSMSEDEAVAKIVELFDGQPTGKMVDLLLDPANGCEGITTVFGVAVMEAATDESLADVLVENGVMTKTKAGKLVAA